MKILYRHILAKYLTTFFFCLLLFTAIVVVVDISEKTDDFAKSGLSTTRIITDYYFGFVPRLDAMLFPLFVFISVIFFTSKMAGRSEIIAILSSGVSFRRFLLPFMTGGLILGGVLWLGYRYVVPPANKKWGDFEKRYIAVNNASDRAKNKSYLQNIYFNAARNEFIGIKGYDTVSKTGTNFFYQKFDGGKLKANLRSATFGWDSAGKKWRLSTVAEREIKPISEGFALSTLKLMDLNFKPIDLRRDEYLKDQMTTPELEQFIARQRAQASEGLNGLLVERYSRDAIPVSVLILTVIGASLASRKVRGGSGAHIAVGVLLSTVYILFSRFSGVFATQGNFPPLLAAWTPNIVFGLLAFWLYRRASA